MESFKYPNKTYSLASAEEQSGALLFCSMFAVGKEKGVAGREVWSRHGDANAPDVLGLPQAEMGNKAVKTEVRRENTSAPSSCSYCY